MVINMEKPEVVLTAVLVVKKGTKVVVNGPSLAGGASSMPGPGSPPQDPGAGAISQSGSSATAS